MWCVIIERSGCLISELFFKTKKTAEKRIKYLKLLQLNKLMFSVDDRIKVTDILNVETIDLLITAFIKQSFANQEDEDDFDTFYKNRMEILIDNIKSKLP